MEREKHHTSKVNPEVPLPFTVIGGYLGAGKTTLLNAILENAGGTRFVVLVNDFGSVNIDASLIRNQSGDTIELANGCMCCSIAGGFTEAIGEIRKRADQFDHMLIEASGVSDPARIAEFGKMYQLPLDAIIVMADAEQVRGQARDKYVGDTVVRQFRQSDLIILNKVDLVSDEACREVRNWLGELAPHCPIVEAGGTDMPLELFKRVRSNGHPSDSSRPDDFGHSVIDHGQIYDTWTFSRNTPISRAALEQFTAECGLSAYRAKGFVRLEDDPHGAYVFNQVGRRWSLTEDEAPDAGDRVTRLVVIGRKGSFSPDNLEALLSSNRARKS